MEDPTTLAINLTYLGTLGLAVLMFLGLGLIIIITLVVAGIGRLVSVILLALIGIFPKKATTSIVHLPPQPARVPDPVTGDVLDSVLTPAPASAPVAAAPAVQASVPPVAAAPVAAPSVAVPAVAAPAAPKRDLLGDVRRRLSSASAAVKDGAWKEKVNPRNLPKPAEVKSVVGHQTAHHPIVVAAAKEPPVLSKDWADAVAEADQRAAARAKAQQPPAIKVTVREVGGPAPAPTNGKTPAPKGPELPSGANKPEASKPGATASPAQGNGAKKPGPNSSKNGKTPSPIRKGSLSSASRNS